MYANWVSFKPPAFKLLSESLKEGEQIPYKYARKYGNVSPQLSWINAPKATKSFLIIMENLHYRKYSNWIVYGIPANKHSLAENEPFLPKRDFFWRKGAYYGPFRDPFEPHKEQIYQIKIYALNVIPDYFDYTNYPEYANEAEERLGIQILTSSTIKVTW